MTMPIAQHRITPLPDQASAFGLASVEDYAPFIGEENVERILIKASRLRDLHVAHVSSTYYGGGVAEILSSLTLLMNGAELRTGWRVIQGRPDFFTITKKMHNALQGDDINLTLSSQTHHVPRTYPPVNWAPQYYHRSIASTELSGSNGGASNR